MKKAIITLSKIVLVLATLNIFAWTISHVYRGGERLAPFTDAIKVFAEFPTRVRRVLSEITRNGISPYHIIADTAFEPLNLLDYNIYGINATSLKNSYQYRLYNFLNDSTVFLWKFPINHFYGEPSMFPVSHPINPIILEDTSLIGVLDNSKNLFRIDKNSNVIWNNNSTLFHHSLNLSHDNFLWACGAQKRYTKNTRSNSITIFTDDIIMKVDITTGKTVFEKSVSEIFIENGYLNMVHGYTNDENEPKGKDLYHLNDIQPINIEGNYWEVGDLLLSLRHRSTIVHYRPTTNKIIRMISGPFIAQHDVDVLPPDKISVFNNNRTSTYSSNNAQPSDEPLIELRGSHVITYDFSDSTFSKPSVKVFEHQRIYTPKQGLHEFLGNGDLFIESTDQGKVFIIRGDKVIYRGFANPVNSSGLTEYPHWIRVYENLNFLK